jgi:peptide deformylase
MKLILDPDPSLRDRCDNTELPTLQEALDSLEIMRASGGIGISSPQVGSNKRFFWMGNELIINPVIKSRGESCARIVEGCLSLPGKQFSVVRSLRVFVSYQNIISQYKERQLDGMKAIVFQHEHDHLEGIMIDDYNHNESRLPD